LTFLSFAAPETTAALHSQEPLWPGMYELQVEVMDAQGLSCPSNEVFIVDLCTCDGIVDCSLKASSQLETTSELSSGALGLLLMAFCLLLCEFIIKKYPMLLCLIRTSLSQTSKNVNNMDKQWATVPCK